MPTLHRRCPRHHVVYTPPARCQACATAASRAQDARRGTTTARGLGADYQQARAAVLAASQTCWICGLPGADTADHLVPRSQGGTSTQENLRPAHKRCNERRGAKP